jgi:methylenetetrahydrofolate reductase (NADPH)
METSLLVNVVHNDFKDPEAIFRPFFAAGAEYAAQMANGYAKTNGPRVNGSAHVNGVTTNGH